MTSYLLEVLPKFQLLVHSSQQNESQNECFWIAKLCGGSSWAATATAAQSFAGNEVNCLRRVFWCVEFGDVYMLTYVHTRTAIPKKWFSQTSCPACHLCHPDVITDT